MEAKKSLKANLENKKIIFFEIGLISALIMALVAFEWKTTLVQSDLSLLLKAHDFEQEDIAIITKPKVELPIPKPISHEFKIVSNDKTIKDDVKINSETSLKEKIVYTPPVLVVKPEDPVVDDNEVFIDVHEYPSFSGGDDAMRKYLSEVVYYPKMAKDANISGTVFVSFIVEKNGSLSNIKLLKSIGGGCDEVAIEAVKNMPKWNPGKQRNMAVRTKLVIPIKFSLKE